MAVMDPTYENLLSVDKTKTREVKSEVKDGYELNLSKSGKYDATYTLKIVKWDTNRGDFSTIEIPAECLKELAEVLKKEADDYEAIEQEYSKMSLSEKLMKFSGIE